MVEPAAQTQAVDPLSPLLNLGATGAILVIALWAVRQLYQQQIATLTQTIAVERERAKEQAVAERARTDRVEAQLTAINEAIRERLITSMASSAETFREALRVLEGGRH